MTDKKFVESIIWTAFETFLVSLGMNRLVFGIVFLFTEYISETAFCVLSVLCSVLAVVFGVAHYLMCVRNANKKTILDIQKNNNPICY